VPKKDKVIHRGNKAKTAYNARVNKWLRDVLPKSRTARVILAIFVVCALALIAYLFSGRKSRTGNDFELAQRAARNRQIENLNRDSDGDGLKDWEEAIFHTDPHNPDTDGDGTPDGEEVRLGRDPLKPNTSKDPAHPNDLMASSTPLAAISQNGSINPALNMTEQFSRSLLPDIVGPVLSGQHPQSEELIQKMSDLNFIKSPEQIWIGARQYFPADIILSQKDNLAAIVTMFTAMSQATIKHASPAQTTQNTIINFVQNPDSESAKASFLSYQNNLDGMIQDIQKIQVPQDYEGFILSYLNVLSKIRYSLTLIGNFQNDPISALLAIKALPQVQDDFAKIVERSKEESKKVVGRITTASANTSQVKP